MHHGAFEIVTFVVISESRQLTDIIAKFTNCHEERLQDHINIEASRFLNVNNITK
jgi:hypothetical protein